MESGNLLSIIVFVLLLGIMGFILLMYLKSIITALNKNLVNDFANSLNKNSNDFKKEFDKFISILDGNFDNHIATINKFTEHLKKETDKYSESVSKFRNSINMINDKSIELIELNKSFTKDLREYSYKDLIKSTEALKSAQLSFSKIESAFIKNSESTKDLLMSFKDFQNVLQNSDKNLQTVASLNNNLESVITNFKETIVQIQIVSNSISVLSESKLKVLVEEVSNILPEIRKETAKYSTDIHGKFSESLDKLDTIAINLNGLTLKYNSLIDGNQKDPITKDYLN
ncbi:MAG: hypothetical protein IPJ45_08970 [Ignavibacteria bacterium]|nr:hypothetical protein [Ignavibacteria bacterium]